MSAIANKTVRTVSMLLVLSLAWGAVTPPALAKVIETGTVLELQSQDDRNDDVQLLLARADVQAALVQLGVDPLEAQLRVASLSDQELAQLKGQMDELPAGGVLELIGAVFVVLLILELTGVINVFNKD